MSDERLAQFKTAWEAEFGETLFESEAKTTFDRLIELYRILGRSIPKDVRDVGDVAAATAPSDHPAPSQP